MLLRNSFASAYDVFKCPFFFRNLSWNRCVLVWRVSNRFGPGFSVPEGAAPEGPARILRTTLGTTTMSGRITRLRWTNIMAQRLTKVYYIYEVMAYNTCFDSDDLSWLVWSFIVNSTWLPYLALICFITLHCYQSLAFSKKKYCFFVYSVKNWWKIWSVFIESFTAFRQEA